MNAGIQKNLTGGTSSVRRPKESALGASQQPSNWLTSIPRGTMKLVEQLRG